LFVCQPEQLDEINREEVALIRQASPSVHAEDPGADGAAIGELAQFGRSEPLARVEIDSPWHPNRDKAAVLAGLSLPMAARVLSKDM